MRNKGPPVRRAELVQVGKGVVEPVAVAEAHELAVVHADVPRVADQIGTTVWSGPGIGPRSSPCLSTLALAERL